MFVEYESDVKEEQERVKKLLENLRIQAEVLVMWLSSGQLRSYEVIVNGAEPQEDDEVEEVLGKEEWWKELQKRRGRASSHNSHTHLADVVQLVTGAQFLGSSFQQNSISAGSRSIRGGFHKLIKKPRRRHSMFGLTRLGMPLSLNMRTHRLNPDALDHGSASEPSSEESSDELSSDEESTASAASENDIGEYSSSEETIPAPIARRASVADPLGLGTTHRKQALWQAAIRSSRLRSSPGDSPHGEPSLETSSARNSVKGDSSLLSVQRPEIPHRSSTPIFSCKAIPDTQVAAEEGIGPSIMFADTKPDRGPAQPHPLSFNDLPSTAQHLILNELIRMYSQDTAVVFTTLPSPQAGTSQSENDSMEYLTGLEVWVVCPSLFRCYEMFI